MTTANRWRRQALQEMRFYQDLAPRIPVPVPELLASTVMHEGVCILISAHGRRTRALEWSDSQWISAATGAAQLHGHGRSEKLPGWVRRAPGSDPQAVDGAVAAWKELGHPAIAAQLPTLLVDVNQTLMLGPTTLIHRDCHVDNLLTDGHELVCVDWQEVATGAGPEDLALLWQRAEFDGAQPPREAMIAAYKAGLGTLLDEPVEQQMLAAELRLLLLEWPHFLPYGDARQQQTMLDRLHEARKQWAS